MVSDVHTRRELDSEAGFTLVELLAAMTLSLIVLFALLQTFDSFSTSAARQTRVTDASDQVRSTIDRIVRDLRQARTIEVADPNDLVYTVTDSSTQTRRERICLDAASRLWRSSVTTISAPAVPIAAGSACPTTASGALEVATLRSANSTTNPVFRYDSDTSGVRNVGITLALNASHVDTSTLRTSAFVRSRAETAPAVTRDDIHASCASSGPVLTLASSAAGLTVRYTDLDGNSLGNAAQDGAVPAGTPLQLPSTATTVVAIVSNAGGAVTQIVQKLAC